jgi:ABC-type transport system involved in cytochrome c biogenesis ATPase subunit
MLRYGKWVLKRSNMLKRMQVKNFTVFEEADFQFSAGLNVIVGENGTGKSHVLKAAYSLLAVGSEAGVKQPDSAPTKTYLQKAYADKFMGVFRPEQLGRLARRRQGGHRCELQLSFDDRQLDCHVDFATSAKSEVTVKNLPQRWGNQTPLYLPTRELLTVYPGFVSLYEGRYLEFEETWRDTCIHLGAPALRGPREKVAARILTPIEAAMGGKAVLDTNGRFYLVLPTVGRMEMPLVAEGLRKLAMLARLIATGAVLDQGYLFWDEPEANLNPRLIRLTANVMHALAQQGLQIFVATHSYFLLKELDILARSSPVPLRFIGLQRGVAGVDVQQADSLVDLVHITALDEELAQYDRDMEAPRA